MQCGQLNSSKSNSCGQLNLSLVLPDCQQVGPRGIMHDHQKLCNNIHSKVEMQSKCTCLVNFARLTINAFAFVKCWQCIRIWQCIGSINAFTFELDYVLVSYFDHTLKIAHSKIDNVFEVAHVFATKLTTYLSLIIKFLSALEFHKNIIMLI